MNRAERRHPISHNRRNHQLSTQDVSDIPWTIQGDIEAGLNAEFRIEDKTGVEPRPQWNDEWSKETDPETLFVSLVVETTEYKTKDWFRDYR